MEALVKKYQQKYRKAREEMARWDELQSRLLSHFGNAAAVIGRLEVLRDLKHYGMLTCVDGIKEALLGQQLETLERIFGNMNDILKQFHSTVLSLDKMSKDACQLSKSGSTPSALRMKIGIKPTLKKCVDGLNIIHEIYQSDFSASGQSSSQVQATGAVLCKVGHGELDRRIGFCLTSIQHNRPDLHGN